METEGMTYEQAIERLRAIVETLERGNIELSKSVTLFREATELTARCESLLAEAEQQLTVLGQTTPAN